MASKHIAPEMGTELYMQMIYLLLRMIQPDLTSIKHFPIKEFDDINKDIEYGSFQKKKRTLSETLSVCLRLSTNCYA